MNIELLGGDNSAKQCILEVHLLAPFYQNLTYLNEEMKLLTVRDIAAWSPSEAEEFQMVF